MNTNQATNEDKFLTAKQAAEYLGIRISYLYKLTHQKTFPYYKPNGKLVYFLQSDLLNFLSGNRVSPKIVYDNCVLCGEATPYDMYTPIDLRENFVEGAGQLCAKCAKSKINI